MRGPKKNLGRIGSSVLTFMGYKRTDKLSLYMDGRKDAFIGRKYSEALILIFTI